MTHKETYPEQYTHELCGQPVRVVHRGKTIAEGVVERVFIARFGLLAAFAGAGTTKTAYSVQDCQALAATLE